MSNALLVRPAAFPADLDAIMAIDRLCFTNPWSREMFEWEARNSDVARVYVAEHAAVIIAYCATWLIFDELHINTLAVTPARQRQGVARRMLEMVFEETRREGALRATLEVRAQNTAARQLYASLGFSEGGLRRAYYQSPVDDALILWRTLDEPGPEARSHRP